MEVLVAEVVLQSLALNSTTRFVGVRFGNVLGSAGSVIPIFQQQIAAIASEFGVLRAKGRVDVTGKALPFVVQAVGRRVDGYFARDRDSVSGRLVVIGMNGLDVAAIAARLSGELIDGHASS